MIKGLKRRARDVIAHTLAKLMKRFAFDRRYFELWQSHGYHVTQLSFYSPLPDTSAIDESVFDKVSELPGIGMKDAEQLALLSDISFRFRSEYEAVMSASKEPLSHAHFYLGNDSFESVDAEVLYAMIRRIQPRRFVEIGSGFSTLLALQAVAKNHAEGIDCKFTAIEPYPREFLRGHLPFPIELKVQQVQEVPLDFFTSLIAGDILFIDSSHVCKIGSDVNYEFLEILPRLAPGVIVHVHDIFLPGEYTRDWIEKQHRFWNEQYLLQAFLCGNRSYEVVWAGGWMKHNHSDALKAAFSSFDPDHVRPASFWIRRTNE
jgi:predicted O-methyltransferase YrrM